MKNEEKYSKQGGFTLIELMIVIAVIGILSAIAIPNFLKYKENGCNSNALSDARTFYGMCLANSTGTGNVTFDSGNLPPGFQCTTTLTGSFSYVGSSGAITCSAAFSHPSGTITYSIDNMGNITEHY